MSQRIGGVVEEDVSLPPGSYFAQFIGFTRNQEGEIVLKEKTTVFTNEDGTSQSRRVTKIYWQFMVVVGPESGNEVVGSTAFKGVSIIPSEAGPMPRFKAPGAYAPNFITWLNECGLDFVGDLSKPMFDTPLTDQTILVSLERVLLDKAKAGHVVSVKVEETQDGGAWIAWKGGVSAAPAEVSEMIKPGLERPKTPSPSGPVTPVQAEQQRVAEYVRYLIALAAAVDTIDAGVLQDTIREQVKEWGIKMRPNVPILSLLSVEQLRQVVDQVAAVLLSEEIEFEPLPPAPPEEDGAGLLKDIPF